jgi:hypothetical protein
MVACRMVWAVEKFSLATGTVPGVEECGRPATELVAVGEDVHEVCQDCARELVKREDANRVRAEQDALVTSLRDWASQVRSWSAQVNGQVSELAMWLDEVASYLEDYAVRVLGS